MEIGKIFVRAIVGIITAGIVTVLVGALLPVETMAAFYLALGVYIYLDKDVSSELPK